MEFEIFFAEEQIIILAVATTIFIFCFWQDWSERKSPQTKIF